MHRDLARWGSSAAQAEGMTAWGRALCLLVRGWRPVLTSPKVDPHTTSAEIDRHGRPVYGGCQHHLMKSAIVATFLLSTP